ncbi:Ribosomal protein L18, bacterial-type [Corchorus olitorius]|uniref:Large ribosomal subunit protein uL18c n=1 Tax=Corchorus olitorius TaxID=93759 RepID=A0A1R3GEY6_9ROSI|nr:Ribosomal protein L18, bacterial-type [Corchorus olitorius]
MVYAEAIAKAQIKIQYEIDPFNGSLSYYMKWSFGKKNALSSIDDAAMPYDRPTTLHTLVYNARGASLPGFETHLKLLAKNRYPMVIIITETRDGDDAAYQLATAIKYPEALLFVSSLQPELRSRLRGIGNPVMGMSTAMGMSCLGLRFPATAAVNNQNKHTPFLGAFQSQSLSLSLGLPYQQRPSSSSSSNLFYVDAKARTRTQDRQARHSRIRKKVEGTPDRPRLCVFRSNKHLYVQVIDDSKMHTLASASTMQKSIRDEFDYSSGPTIEVAKKIGELIAKSCLEKGITKVAFDRGGYPYHGRIEAIAASARENGLQF